MTARGARRLARRLDGLRDMAKVGITFSYGSSAAEVTARERSVDELVGLLSDSLLRLADVERAVRRRRS